VLAKGVAEKRRVQTEHIGFAVNWNGSTLSARDDIMPLYEYECQACHSRIEKILKFSDPELTVCPHCGGALERTITAPAFNFAGGGWYKDLYSSAKPAESSGRGDSASSGIDSSSGGASTSTAAAPAAAPTAPAVTSIAPGASKD